MTANYQGWVVIRAGTDEIYHSETDARFMAKELEKHRGTAIRITKVIEASAQQGEPTSFSAWLESNQDSIEPLDRTEATAQWFDEKEKDEDFLE